MYFNTPHLRKDKEWFYPGTTFTSTEWVTWTRPPEACMVFFLVVGGGAAGTNGGAGANTINRGGGAGGGSGGVSTLMIDSAFLPDTLFISAGRGGTTLSAGDTYVSLRPSISTEYVLIGAQAASAAVGGPIWTTTKSLFFEYGVYNFYAGLTGGAAGSPPTNLSVDGHFVTGGAGGAGATAAGVSYNGASIIPTNSSYYPSAIGGTGNSALSATAGNGNDGYRMFSPIRFYGGAGGGSASSGRGGNGGNGGWGCGGGGGGAGIAGQAGIGGNGGPGFVYIKSI